MAEEFLGPETEYKAWPDNVAKPWKFAQTFTAQDTHCIGLVKIKAYADENFESGNLVLSLQRVNASGNPDGVELASGSAALDDLTKVSYAGEWFSISLDSSYEITTSERQICTPNAKATSGTFTMTYDGQTTGDIAYDATTAQIKTALEALSSVEVDDIAVSGTIFSAGTGGLILTFLASLGDVSMVSVTSSMGGATIVTVTDTSKYALVFTFSNAVPAGDTGINVATTSPSGYSEGEAQTYSSYTGSWTVYNWDCLFQMGSPPEKPITPAPENEEKNVAKTTSDLTWEDGGGAATFNVYFGTTSGALTELTTELDVATPEWTAPMVVLEIKDYNPEATSGYRSPIVGDILTHDTTTYTLWDVKRGQLVNTQYEAKLYATRVGPPCVAGDVLTNGIEPDPNDPQAVSVTLNDEWHFTGEVESAYYPYATRYYWRVDAVNEAGTTTGDEWYFDTRRSYLYERNSSYNPDANWLYTSGSYQWADIYTSGGGRYHQQLVVMGFNCVYFGSI